MNYRIVCLCMAFPAVAAWAQEQAPSRGGKTSPHILSAAEPKYTPEASRANVAGNVVLSLIVDTDGRAKDIQVVSPLGHGLDQKAIEAVSKWRFQSGKVNGVVAPVKATVEVRFRLLNSEEAPNPRFDQSENARSRYNTGIHQLKGDLGPKDEAAGFKSVEEAARMDYEPAQYMLGKLWLNGTGTKADPAQAAEWFDRAAAQGDPRGDFELARMNAFGVGVAQNSREGYRLFAKAAEQNLAEAQYSAAVLLEAGDGVAQDREAAEHWYRKSAEQGVGPAQYRLARLYWSGSQRDPVKALSWALIAANNGQSDASKAVTEWQAAMDPSDISKAQHEADRFKPHPAKLQF